MFEYNVQMSDARTPEDMKFVSIAFRAGLESGGQRATERIIKLLTTDSGCGDWAVNLIQKEMYEDQTNG
jgi:hypothetical protein